MFFGEVFGLCYLRFIVVVCVYFSVFFVKHERIFFLICIYLHTSKATAFASNAFLFVVGDMKNEIREERIASNFFSLKACSEWPVDGDTLMQLLSQRYSVYCQKDMISTIVELPSCLIRF